ncbi:MAG: Maf family protein [Candidatus Eremiobacteraeota bacterium]|nr:Maf family protein [Candidatus Eremiobacteraeota bacterium]
MRLSELVLASASPRRLELLRSIGLHVRVVPSMYEEPVLEHLTPRELAISHAREKARAVAAMVRTGVVVGADTVVDVDGTAFGKPRDANDAARMLHALSGRDHLVHTAYTVIDSERSREETEVETTSVRFFSLSAQEVAEYVARGESFDKAGAYGIQGFGATLVARIDGDFYTVMGFPLGRFVRTLARMGF